MTAPITGKRLLLPLAPLFLVAATLAGGLEWHGQSSSAQENPTVEGAPVTCPDGRSFESVFEIDGARFHVLGALAAIEGRDAVITGPTGDVPITFSDSAAVSMGLVIGEPVDATGMIDELGVYTAETVTALCAAETTPRPEQTPEPTPAPVGPTGTPTPTPAPELLADECNRGPGHAGDLRLEVKDGEVKIKRGTVISFTDGAFTVDTPGGPLSVRVTSDTEIKGDLSLAGEVRIEGAFDADGNIVAEEVRALCPDAARGDDDGDDEADDHDDGDDDDDMDEAAEHDRATPAVPAIPAIPGESGDPATPAVPAIPAVPPHDFDDDHEDNGNSGHGGGGGHDGSGHGHGGNEDHDDDDDD